MKSHTVIIADADFDAFWQQSAESLAHWEIPDKDITRLKAQLAPGLPTTLREDALRGGSKLVLENKGWSAGHQVVFQDRRRLPLLRVKITKLVPIRDGFCVYWNPDDAEKL